MTDDAIERLILDSRSPLHAVVYALMRRAYADGISTAEDKLGFNVTTATAPVVGPSPVEWNALLEAARALFADQRNAGTVNDAALNGMRPAGSA